MMKRIACISALSMGFLSLSSIADESAQYNQKNLPNGDVETTFAVAEETRFTFKLTIISI